jgi:hypothetical protein
MTPKLKGSHPWALILCYPRDQTPPPSPGIDYFWSLINSPATNGLDAWWQQMSGGMLDLFGSTVLGWYRLSNTLSDGSHDPGPCPAGDRHDHNGSDAYGPLSFHNDAVQLVATLVAGQSWSDKTGRITFQCTAVDDASATVQVNVG